MEMSQVARQLHVEEGQTRYNPGRKVSQQTKTQPKPKRVTKGEKLLWTMGVAIMMALAIAIVSTQASIHAASGEVQELQSKIEKVQKTNRQLHVEVTKLSNPERIRRIAKEKLGLELNAENVKLLP